MLKHLKILGQAMKLPKILCHNQDRMNGIFPSLIHQQCRLNLISPLAWLVYNTTAKRSILSKVTSWNSFSNSGNRLNRIESGQVYWVKQCTFNKLQIICGQIQTEIDETAPRDWCPRAVAMAMQHCFVEKRRSWYFLKNIFFNWF